MQSEGQRGADGSLCDTARDRGTVRPAAAAGRPAQAFQRKAGKAVERGREGGVEVSGIAQACADTSLPREVLSAAK